MNLLKLFIFCLFFMLISACSSSLFSKNIKIKGSSTIILGTSPDYPPYESINKNGDIIGFDIDLAHAIAEKMNKNIIIKQMSFDALILALNSNKIDMIISGVSSTNSRRKKINLIPYDWKLTKKYTLLFWEKIPYNAKKYKKLKDFGDFIFCVQSGTTMSNFLANIPNINIKVLESTIDLVLDIMFKKSLAALVETNAAIKLKKKKSELKLLTLHLPKKDWVMGYSIGIRKGDEKMSDTIKEILLELKSDGSLSEIRKKWLQD